MDLPYTEEIIESPDGIPCRVLEIKALTAQFKNSNQIGRKSAETIVKEALGGEDIITKNKEGKIESTYVAEKGDAIFIQPHNRDDIYVPGRTNGMRYKFNQLREMGYQQIFGVEPDGIEGAIIVKSAVSFKLLPEAVTEPTCIKNAWGPGQHQFLYEKATLKQNHDGSVTGIDKEAFDQTWDCYFL